MREITPSDGRDDGAGGSGDGTHPAWEQLNDHVDGRLSGDSASLVDRHLTTCDACRAAVESLQSVAAGAATLPPAIDPPAGLWEQISATIEQGITPPIVPARSSAAVPIGSPTRPKPWVVSMSPLRLAAAAVVLMTLTSVATARFQRRASRPQTAEAVNAADAVPARVAPAGVLSASFSATERTYLASVAEVQALLVRQRAALSPATIAVVDRAIATIDAAIAEARVALLADPANQALAERLESNYRQKLDLLRRAAEFPQSS